MIAFADVGQLEKTGSSETKLDDVMDSLLCMSFVGSISSFLAIAVDRYGARMCTQQCFFTFKPYISLRDLNPPSAH